ncbi:MAG: SGNH/GDSL hydrolase family protein [Rubritepida sp.]|nr:SGNH/GDSL hydrolase family protein [Rubritepida sp.]
MRRRALLGMVFAALLLPRAAPALTIACDVPAETIAAARPLPAVARALDAGTLRILALGSGSVTGPGTSGPEAAWPGRLQALLAARHPGLRIEVTVRGGRGVSVADHLALMRDGAVTDPPALVIWQAGTIEAVRGMDPDEMTQAMRQGLERIRRTGADAIVMDPQYSRFLRANTNIEPYLEKLRLVAASAGAGLFSRYDLMQHWVEAGAVDLERTPRGDRTATMDRLNDCLARALAAMISRGVAEAR